MNGPRFFRYIISSFALSVFIGLQFGPLYGMMAYSLSFMIVAILDQRREDMKP